MLGVNKPPPPTGKYALVAGVKPTAVRSDDWNELQLQANRMQGAEVFVSLPDGTKVSVGRIDYTRVELV